MGLRAAEAAQRNEKERRHEGKNTNAKISQRGFTLVELIFRGAILRGIVAGSLLLNHNQTLVRSDDPPLDLAEAAAAEATGDFKRERTAAIKAAENVEHRSARILIADALLRDCWASNDLRDRRRGLDTRRLKYSADLLHDGGDHTQARGFYKAALPSR